MNVFCGFICLRPCAHYFQAPAKQAMLKLSKNIKAVVAELKAYWHRKWTSYIVLQSDQGSVFKGAVKEIFRKLPVKLAHSTHTIPILKEK